MNKLLTLSLALSAALALSGCGASTDDAKDNTGSTGNTGGTGTGGAGTGGAGTGGAGTGGAGEGASQKFTATAQWAITPAKGESKCFDFDGNGEADCAGATWDLKLSLGSGARDSAMFYTNSGPQASGKGGALGSPLTYSWDVLKAMVDTSKAPASTDPLLGPMFSADAMANGFSDATPYGAFAYAEQKMLAKFSVYLVTTDNTQAYSATSNSIYAVQPVDYYGGASGSASGHPKIRYVKLSDSTNVKEVAVDASKAWAYLNLDTGAVVSKTDTWHLGFNRYSIITNSGASGTGTVGSFLAQKATAFYKADGEVDATKLTDEALKTQAKAMLTDASGWKTPSAASKWIKDSLSSTLNPSVTGDISTGFNYGFYFYTAMSSHEAGMHKFIAQPQNGVLLRSGEGTSFARVHLSSIVEGLYTFDFDVAPAPAK